jgi:uncharacterized membrane protein YqiK
MNSPPTEKVSKLTADAIRANGLEAAEKIRTFAAVARKEGEAVAAYAEEVAAAVTQASQHVADRIAEYMKRCENARVSIDEHKDLLTQLPDQSATEAAPLSNDSPELKALEKELIGPRIKTDPRNVPFDPPAR